MIKEIDWVLSKPKFILKSKLLNWPWKTRLERYRTTEIEKGQRIISYLNRYATAFKNTQISTEEENHERGEEKERIFSIWLQGEKDAPTIVKACFSSIRSNCKQELIVLDKESLFDWIELPDYIMTKWKNGNIRPAHFADICRLELLYRYGGFWLDATDFVTSPFPQWLVDTDFFVYHTGNNDKFFGFFAFIQNCFIRARKHNTLVKAWRDAVFVYWQTEVKTRNYFIHQLIFKKVIDCNPAMKELYNKMPYLVQDPTHTIWFEYAKAPFDRTTFEELTSKALFQKTKYNSSSSTNPIPNSYADVLIKMYSNPKT